ncbi:nuclear transport factor 2 family protein [Caulobacter sp. 17J65-9]|uniref:nuclear transport factor 2 family protein n=1 Tax=Caulobacter sp. 17J65-9 TaxID=2709382 RepID=UPI0013C9BFE5|nr:nuclear transport factor 2 family protein [Caulobacter sp. 17J65-9]NEX93756.1 nuclear transport factor 2 family protein [Caulobacter sp. 17J65-9]
MRSTTILSGVIAVLLATSASAKTPAASPDDVAAAERAFAALAQEVGIVDSFRANAAPEGVVFSPDPINAQANLAAQKSEKGPPFLKWWPIWAGVAASGDLGFTTGPATYDDKSIGYYFTVWAKQPDGSWKWLLDHGSGPVTGDLPGTDTPLNRLAVSSARSPSAKRAYAGVQAAEARLNADMTADPAGAFAAVIVDDTRVMGLGTQLTTGREATVAALARRPAGMTATPLAGAASKAGDFAYTYGDVRWTGKNGPRRGHYVRIWQKRAGGWRLVFDEVVMVRQPG